MKTSHTLFFQDSRRLGQLPSQTVDLIVTSPPYPMIEMWDKIFFKQNAAIEAAIEKQQGRVAFELMHTILDSVWDETFRILKPGGFACINIGDATRSLQSNFAIYPNHARILTYLVQTGFTILPGIIWRKQTNAPNKFMGSGMLPAGAYVTLEHEYILIARKSGKREFKTAPDRQRRRESAIFWEERNLFFSDIWFDIKGSRQGLRNPSSRTRSAAFPFEVPHRLINMYSVKGDTVLDPFLGTGTTMSAAMASARNSIGCDIDKSFFDEIILAGDTIIDSANRHIKNRLNHHIDFVKKRTASGKSFKHKNFPYGFPVVTRQEKDLVFDELKTVRRLTDQSIQVDYCSLLPPSFCR